RRLRLCDPDARDPRAAPLVVEGATQSRVLRRKRSRRRSPIEPAPPTRRYRRRLPKTSNRANWRAVSGPLVPDTREPLARCPDIHAPAQAAAPASRCALFDAQAPGRLFPRLHQPDPLEPGRVDRDIPRTVAPHRTAAALGAAAT